MHNTNRFLAIAAAGLLFIAYATLPGAFASTTDLSSSTYQAWEARMNGVIATSPVADVSGDGVGDLVVAAGGKSIHLIDGMTGDILWSHTATGEPYGWMAVMGAPDASGDGRPDVLAATKNRIFMFDGAEGGQLWNFTTRAGSSDLCFPATRSVHAISDIDGDALPDIAILAGSGDQCAKFDDISVFALGTKDGSEIWEYSYKEDYHGLKDGVRGSSPAAVIDFDGDGVKDVAFVDDQNLLHVVDGQTGDALEMTELGVFGVVWNLVAVPDISGDGIEDAIAFEFIGGGGGPDYASVDAIDLASAEIIWQAKAGDGLYEGGAMYSVAWVPNDDVDYVAVTQRVDNDLQLVVLDAGSGDPVWQFDLGEERSRNDLDKHYPVAHIRSLSQNSYDEIAVASIDSTIYLLDGMKGGLIWSHPVGGQISDIASIEMQGGQAFIVVEDQEDGVRALAGLTSIETRLEISASAQTLSLTPLPDRITVSGILTPAFRGEVVELRYIEPTGDVMTVPLVVEGDGSFTHVIEPQIAGTWRVTAEFDGEGFYLDSKSPAITFTVTEGGETESRMYRLEVDGSDTSYPITYRIEGGNVTGMSIDEENKSLDIVISATQDGTLTVRLPRSVIDAFESSYQVYVDGQAADFQETEADEGFRTLAIPFSGSAEQVQVTGTYIVPEFPLTLVVMALATAGVIVAATTYGRRFRLH
jgi:outer membrane protein assembly factor BamB